MRALVTGSEGFIGRHLCTALWDRGDEVVEIDTNKDNRLRFGPRDCLDFFHHDESHFDVSFHCAAFINGRVGIELAPLSVGAMNLEMDAAYLSWAARTGPGRVVYVSSSAAYPVWRQSTHGFRRPLTEDMVSFDGDHVGNPDATYGWSKLTGEILCHHLRRAGIDVTVVRPFSGYGEDQDLDYPFPMFIDRAMAPAGTPFMVWGDGRQVRDFVHVDDVVGAILAAVANKIDGPVNIGTGIGTSMIGLAKLCLEVVGREGDPIELLLRKPTGVEHRVAETSYMDCFYEPRIDLLEGVTRAVTAARARMVA